MNIQSWISLGRTPILAVVADGADKQQKRDAEERLKRIKEEDEEMLAIIRTFISCQNLETV